MTQGDGQPVPHIPAASNAVRTNDATDALIGRVVAGRFRVVELVARGGMGCIYRAIQEPLGREVALKVLAPSTGNTGSQADDARSSADGFRARFEREASLSSRLNHANTVRVFDYGFADDVYFIAMEFVAGITLHQALRRDAPFEPSRAVHIARQICGSLREAHSAGIVHRDLKPGNVLLTTQNEDGDYVKVVDFGLVKQVDDNVEVTQAGLIVGSPLYMAPEQIRGRQVDLRADVYSLGVLMYHMLAGVNPFERDTSVAVLVAHLQEPVPSFVESNPRVKVPASLEWVVQTCLAKDRAHRFRDLGEVLRAFKAVEVELLNGHPCGALSLDADGRTRLPPAMTDPMLSRVTTRPIPLSTDSDDDSVVRSAVRTGIPVAGFAALLIGVGALGLAIIVLVYAGSLDTGLNRSSSNGQALEPSTTTSPDQSLSGVGTAAASPGPTEDASTIDNPAAIDQSADEPSPPPIEVAPPVRQSAPRQSAPRQSAPRQSAPRQSAPRPEPAAAARPAPSGTAASASQPAPSALPADQHAGTAPTEPGSPSDADGPTDAKPTTEPPQPTEEAPSKWKVRSDIKNPFER